MPCYHFLWDDNTIDHLAQHAVTPADFEAIVSESDSSEWGKSRSTGRPIAFGNTADGRKLACVFEIEDDFYCVPVTAYEVD
jgi:uncharacterized DUF497 family protein